MSDSVFIDTNVLIYAVGPRSEKRRRAEALLVAEEEAVVSAQVTGEFVNVCLKKKVLPREQVGQAARDFMDVLRFVTVDRATIQRGLRIHDQHSLSWWDSLIVAAALEHGCTALYTEDLQNRQMFEGRLLITNPFAPTAS